MSETRSEGTTVLYVDGDGEACGTVRDCLDGATEEFRVRTAGGYESALETVRTHRVDCVVTEHALPDGDGFDLLAMVREQYPSLPVVLYPTGGDEGLAADAIAAGVTRYQPREPVEETCEELAKTVVAAIEEASEERAALDRMTDAFFAVDSDWRFTYLNERGETVIREAMPEEKRAAVDTLRGVSFLEAVPAVVGTPFYDRYHEAMERQEPTTFEEYYEPLETWFEVSVYPSPSGLSVYFDDVTETKEHEQALEHRESVLTSMYRIVSDTDRTFEEKLDELFTIGREELDTEYATLSRVDGDEYTFAFVQTPEGDDAIEDGDTVPLSWTSCELAVSSRERLAVEDMSEASPEVVDRRGNEALGLGCYLGTPVFVDDEVYGTFCFYGSQARAQPFSQWQITLVDLMGNWVSYEREREHREAELTRERNRLEKFASVVSHDLRNPLNIAASNLELAREHHDSEYLDSVATGLDRMETLIEDVLALARLGQQVVEEEPIEFTDLVRTAWTTVGDSSSELVVSDGISTVLGDRTRLQQLFENLFRNAIEHGADGGGVTVRVGPLADDRGLYVADDGPGIPEDERGSVFEHGYTTDEEGTGFGLSIVAEIVSAHGGEITVTDRADGGARFEMTDIEVR